MVRTREITVPYNNILFDVEFLPNKLPLGSRYDYEVEILSIKMTGDDEDISHLFDDSELSELTDIVEDKFRVVLEEEEVEYRRRD